MNQNITTCFKDIRSMTPLVHAITNYVTINDCANILLAAGASPAMCEAADEAFEFSQLANALYLNSGSFTKEQEMAMYMAIRGAVIKNIPVVLDPVGCAAVPIRMRFVKRLRYFGPLSVIKGNIGEIKAIAGVPAQVRGVDSLDEGKDCLEICQKLARELACIVVATGKTDIITDGKRSCLVQNGTEMFTKITGAGCMVGALIAGFCGACDEYLDATVAAVSMMTIAGELAQELPGGKLPGTFKTHLFDQISLIDESIFLKRSKITWE